jgi:hypothetical protein
LYLINLKPEESLTKQFPFKNTSMKNKRCQKIIIKPGNSLAQNKNAFPL